MAAAVREEAERKEASGEQRFLRENHPCIPLKSFEHVVMKSFGNCIDFLQLESAKSQMFQQEDQFWSKIRERRERREAGADKEDFKEFLALDSAFVFCSV